MWDDVRTVWEKEPERRDAEDGGSGRDSRRPGSHALQELSALHLGSSGFSVSVHDPVVNVLKLATQVKRSAMATACLSTRFHKYGDA